MAMLQHSTFQFYTVPRHSTNTPVDDVSEGTEDFSIIQYVTNITVH
jgi:hypothetical protein